MHHIDEQVLLDRIHELEDALVGERARHRRELRDTKAHGHRDKQFEAATFRTEIERLKDANAQESRKCDQCGEVARWRSLPDGLWCRCNKHVIGCTVLDGEVADESV